MLSTFLLIPAFIVSGAWWGGSSLDEVAALAKDESGNLYVAGTTHSLDFAAAGGGLSARPAKHAYPGDIFVQKTSISGSLVWRAVIGGSFTDKALAISVDKSGAVYVTGLTYSLDFPVTAGAYRRTSANPQALASDAFVLKLTPQGDRLLYSTYFGGSEGDQANSIAVDESGQAVIAGETYSDDIPVTAGVVGAKVCPGLGYDGFLAKLGANGSGVAASTYLCGSGHDRARAIALDAQGAVYVAGETASRDFPVSKGSFRETMASSNFDAFAVKLSPDFRTLHWGTYLGGAETERAAALGLDPRGRLLIAGETRSDDFPGAARGPAGMQDGFVTRLSADGKAVEWTQLFGGMREELVTCLELNARGDVWVGGWTRSPDWAGELLGAEDGFIAFLDAGGETPAVITRLGGRLRDRIYSIRLAGPYAAAAGFTEAPEWIGEGKPGAGQADGMLALVDARTASASPAAVSDAGRRRPESGWRIWSGDGRIAYTPSPVRDGFERWIVELKLPPAAVEAARWKGLRGAAREAGLLRSRQAVRAAQAGPRLEVERAGGRIFGSLDLIANAFFVEADAESAARLRALDSVKRVIPAGTVEPDLDTSLKTHKVFEAWDRIGGEANAGAGVKLGIIDTGVDASHPAFAGAALETPEGFPRANRQEDLANTNSKVIVARGYAPAGGAAHARDTVAHGTGVASVAGGIRADTALGPITGVAPAVYLGNYKVLTNETAQLSDDTVVLTGMEDAAADGMDVLNLSLHTNKRMLRPEDDIYTDACERLAAMGVITVRASGNEGPDFSTLTNPHLGEWGILVGNHAHARTLATSLETADGLSVIAVPGSNNNMSGSGAISGPLADVQQIAPNTWGCSALPADSLRGRIALIDRGSCTFAVKGENARRAGAAAIVVLALAEAPEPLAMSMGSEQIPAFMVSHADGQKLRQKTAAGAAVSARIPLAWQPFERSPDGINPGSSSGPGVSQLGVKPDLVATGSDVWCARPGGGWAAVTGTSFSAPHVAGAMAVLRGHRPGLDLRHYRSLLINTAVPLLDAAGKPLPVMAQGAGRLNLEAALAATVTAYPTSLHLGSSRGSFQIERPFKLFNLGAEAATCQISILPRAGAAPVVEPSELAIDAGGEAWAVLKWQADNWKPGQYDGVLRVDCQGQSSLLSIPYWHGVTGNTVSGLKIVMSESAGKAGQPLYWAAQFRLVDEAGLPLDGMKPAVTVVSGSGAVLDVFSFAHVFPGIYVAHVRPGPGQNVFRISAGGLTRDFTITGE